MGQDHSLDFAVRPTAHWHAIPTPLTGIGFPQILDTCRRTKGPLMARYDYRFVDESGDPAFKVDPISHQPLSSNFYTAAALHVCDDSFRDLNKHIAAFRYFRDSIAS